MDLAPDVVYKKLQNDDNLSNRTDLSVENIIKLLEFILNHSFFVYKQQYYKQIFGCAMGSPVSAIIANLVIQFVEEKAIETAPIPPKWWYRFVDDSHPCLRKHDAHSFLTHLNSINPHINFTMEMAKDGCLPFLDTLAKRDDDKITVEVYRKPTHTDKYLDFSSCHPAQHKRSVVKTLMDRAEKIPSTLLGKTNETKYVQAVLKENVYNMRFQNSCRQITNNEIRTETRQNNTGEFFTTLPYIQGVSEKLSRILRNEGLKV